MRIRPCIDIHNGRVKQIVGGSICENGGGMSRPHENYVAAESAAFFAALYREAGLDGGHVILLNSVSDAENYEADVRQALEALRAFPGGLQIGGGITPETAGRFLDAGASHVIVTSYVFRGGELDEERLEAMIREVGKERLVLDLSCRRLPDGRSMVVTDRWQKFTRMEVCDETLDRLCGSCDEFLVHAADVEGERGGADGPLAELLGAWTRGSGFPVTYAGGIHSLQDLELLHRYSGGALDVTVGSALDLFGGDLRLEELVRKCRELDHPTV